MAPFPPFLWLSLTLVIKRVWRNGAPPLVRPKKVSFPKGRRGSVLLAGYLGWTTGKVHSGIHRQAGSESFLRPFPPCGVEHQFTRPSEACQEKNTSFPLDPLSRISLPPLLPAQGSLIIFVTV